MGGDVGGRGQGIEKGNVQLLTLSHQDVEDGLLGGPFRIVYIGLIALV